MTDKRVLRFDVGITDQEYEVPEGTVVMFDRGNRNRTPGLESLLAVWIEVKTPEEWPDGPDNERKMMVRVVRTGEPVRLSAEWLASCMDGEDLWHLYRTGPWRMPRPDFL